MPSIQRTSVRWLAAALALVANLALAAECDMQLSSREVNYGALYRGELTTGAAMSAIALGKRQLTLTVACRQPTAMGLRFDATPAGEDAYRFARQGAFTVRLHDATLDGRPVQLASRSANGDTGSPSGAAQMKPGGVVVTAAEGAEATGKVFTVQVEIDTRIDDAATRARDISVLEGHGSFHLVPR
ncbi:hypothetical protein [Oceanisphaera sp. KMM 10153]|uniref:hypothetical protein n=1 Tax=Oceanisphaera submarina TaxID=3390193 RepID=UPI0039755297